MCIFIIFKCRINPFFPLSFSLKLARNPVTVSFKKLKKEKNEIFHTGFFLSFFSQGIIKGC